MAVAIADELSGEFSGHLWLTGSVGGSDDGQGHWRPAERSPASAMGGRVAQRFLKLLALAPAGHSTKERGQVHGIPFARPLLALRIVVSKPTTLPHAPRPDREFVGNTLPPGGLSQPVLAAGNQVSGGSARLFHHPLLLGQNGRPACHNSRSLSHAGLQIHRAHMLDECPSGLLRPKA